MLRSTMENKRAVTMTDTQILQFVTVAKYLNFSRAAEVLYVSQPALSKQIQKLEKELGFPLFARSTHDVQLTPAGKTMFRYFDSVLSSYEQVLRKAKEQSAEASNEIFIGVLDNSSYDSVIARLSNAARSAGKSIRIEFHDHAALQEYLKVGYIDMAVTRYEPDDADPDWEYKELEVSEDLIYVSEQSELAAYDTVESAAFSGHTICVPEPGDADSVSSILRLTSLLDIAYQDIHPVPNLETGLYMLAHQDAMIFADDHLVVPPGYKAVSTGVFHSVALIWCRGSLDRSKRKFAALL